MYEQENESGFKYTFAKYIVVKRSKLEQVCAMSLLRSGFDGGP